MVNIIWPLILLATMTSITRGNWENRIIHRLDVVQDVTVAKRNNVNYYIVLLVGRLTHDPLKRSLVQFENLKTSCPAHKTRFQKCTYFFGKHSRQDLFQYINNLT